MRSPDPRLARGPLVRAAFLIGFALSGFFDGILLHQVLQWHHLFSLVPGQTWRDTHNQILMDGLFHVLMYGIAAAGLAMLWRARHQLGDGGSSCAIVGGALLGFGAWNLIDVVGFHWLLGIHRIRVGVPDPLAYDLGWLALFALPFLAVGWLMLRTNRDSGPSGALTTLLLGALVPAVGTFAARPAPDSRTAVALFASPAAAFRAAAATDARIVWLDSHTGLAAIAAARPHDLDRLPEALFVSRSAAVAGCLAWTTI